MFLKLADPQPVHRKSAAYRTSFADGKLCHRQVGSLSEAQNPIYLSDRDVSIAEVIHESIKAHLDHEARVTMSGPMLRVSSQRALGPSMAIYELATNALKYDALSNSTGTIAITWSIADDDVFELV